MNNIIDTLQLGEYTFTLTEYRGTNSSFKFIVSVATEEDPFYNHTFLTTREEFTEELCVSLLY